MYYCIELSRETQNKILKVFNEFFAVPMDWKVYCDHITLIHSSNKDWRTVSKILMNFIGHKVSFKLNGIGYNDSVMALAVSTYTANDYSHITICVAPNHKPAESNDIKKWEMLYCAEEFEGVVKLKD